MTVAHSPRQMAQTQTPLADRAGWDAALRGIPHAFAHTHGYCRAISRTSGMEPSLHVCDDGAHRVVCPLASRQFAGEVDLLTPYGFAGFTGNGVPEGFSARWAAHMRDAGFVCAYVGLNPILGGERYADPAWLAQHNSLFVLDLTIGADQLFTRMSENRRRQIRRWPRESARLVTDRDRLTAFFGEHLRAFLDARRAANVYYFNEATLAELFALDDLVMIGAAVHDRLEAVSVFGHTPYVGDFLFNVSIPGGEWHSAPLIWLGALELQSRGVPRLNLGGGIRQGDGVAAFKARFGGDVMPLWSARPVFAPGRFAALCARAGVPATRDGYFPPYHRP